ncbi:hypothetical protein CVT26_003611 [Gymnopilus dilepis]|uniref:CxC2-like cysteine cluster KDZ transposase-associated domain-containing protein n=1 Tax=Gymnopilus dilepis TaxID=231916 RepID=A0A409WUA3_9AGAR|nr:hypothetical protein CVT26_003611 [Gymnopilus dilepis]
MKRSRRYDADFNISGDEDTNIAADCHASSGNITYSCVNSTTKRARKASETTMNKIFGQPLSMGQDSMGQESMGQSFALQERPVHVSPANDSGEQRSEWHPRCKQGASVTMSAFSKELPMLHKALFSKEYHRDIGAQCECGLKEAKYRCRSCTQQYLRCRSCIVKDHHLSVWHHLEEWLGTHFGRVSLSSLGYRHRLGHDGKRCPHRSETSPARRMTIIHTNGFHEVFVEFCACNNSLKQPYQLIDADLFPATLDKPETAFTLEILDTFQKISLRSKITIYDYHRSLQEMTSSVLAEEVPNRYHEFGQVFRVWNHITQIRRSGQCHDFDEVFPYRRQGSMTVRCPACPEVHVNVDKKTIEEAREDETHKYTLFLSIDGNFKLRRKNKRGDPDDVSLNDGRGYFVPSLPYAKYLDHTKNECEDDLYQDNACGHLRALKFRNALRYKNSDVSGVIIVQCARHGFYQPEGMADLKRGEAFRNTDYALARALSDAQDQRWIMVTYDIWCSYHKKLPLRFRKWFSDMLPMISKIRGAIPKMHIKNHEVNCQYCWALNYLKYSGETAGELIEACHSEQNGAAASTKEQNPGHRHDSLDGIVNYWNWTKFRTMGKIFYTKSVFSAIVDTFAALLLYRAFIRCLDTLKTREKQFLGLTARLDLSLVRRWEAMDDTPRVINKEVQSVHRPAFGKGPPTLAQTFEKLLKEECARNKAGINGVGMTENISKALEIEEMQLDVKELQRACNKSEAAMERLLASRESLQDELDKWRAQQLLIFPKLGDVYYSKVSGSVFQLDPENEPLLLPSNFSETHRMYLDLEIGGNIEKELRKGRAHERLDNVRTAIQTYNHHVAIKAKEVRSQRHITRSQGILDGLREDIRKPARYYNKILTGLWDLGHPRNDSVLRVLQDADLWAKNTALPAKLGDSRLQDPWIWHTACPAGTSTAERASFQRESEASFIDLLLFGMMKTVQVDRVKYFRDRSLRDRAREEHAILEEEFERTIRSYNALQDAWKRQAGKASCRGSTAYAYKQAGMLERLSQHCIKQRARATQKAEDFDRWWVVLNPTSLVLPLR